MVNEDESKDNLLIEEEFEIHVEETKPKKSEKINENYANNNDEPVNVRFNTKGRVGSLKDYVDESVAIDEEIDEEMEVKDRHYPQSAIRSLIEEDMPATKKRKLEHETLEPQKKIELNSTTIADSQTTEQQLEEDSEQDLSTAIAEISSGKFYLLNLQQLIMLTSV